MAKDKKGFILYADQKELFDQLPNEKAGELIKFIFSYVNDENPTTNDLILNMAFTPIKQQFKRDLKKWESTREARSKAGKASAESRRIKKEQSSTNSTNVKSVQQTLTKSTVNDNVNVNVTVTDKVIDINTISTPAKAVDGIDFNLLLNFINKTLGKNFRTINDTLKAKYKARLKDGYTKEDIQKAIVGASKSAYHLETNYKHLRPDFFSRADKIDMYSNLETSTKKGLSMKEQVSHLGKKASSI